jgi:RNA recognition motif-containing protein
MDKEDQFKVFVGNVPFECTDKDFINPFKDMDGFVDAKVIRHPKSLTSTRGFGFVCFEKQEHIDNLLKNTIKINDREVRISNYEKQKPHPVYAKKYFSEYPNKLFVQNIPPNITHEKFEEYFSEYGAVSRCYLITDRDSGIHKGKGVVHYMDMESYNKVMNEKHEMNGKELKIQNYRQPINGNGNSNGKENKVALAFSNGYQQGFKAGYQVGKVEQMKLLADLHNKK